LIFTILILKIFFPKLKKRYKGILKGLKSNDEANNLMIVSINWAMILKIAIYVFIKTKKLFSTNIYNSKL
jgi:hypothetical protein